MVITTMIAVVTKEVGLRDGRLPQPVVLIAHVHRLHRQIDLQPRRKRQPPGPFAGCNARTSSATAAAFSPRTVIPPGQVTSNIAVFAGMIAARFSSWNRGGAEDGVIAIAPRCLARCNQSMNVKYLIPSRSANARCVSPLFPYASINNARSFAGTIRRPRSSRFSPVSTHSVIVAPISEAYPLLLLPHSRSPAGRLPLPAGFFEPVDSRVAENNRKSGARPERWRLSAAVIRGVPGRRVSRGRSG